VEKIPMVPSAGCSGGGSAAATTTAFVANNFQRVRPGGGDDERRGRTTISSSSSSSAASSSYNESNNNTHTASTIFSSRGGHQSHQSTEIQPKKQSRVPRHDEPNLYDIPSILRPTYRPLPFLVRIFINLSSAAISWKEFFTLTFTIHHKNISATFKNIMTILVRYLVVSSVAKLCLQEIRSPPSRVTTKYLAENDLLPSTLSRYQFVTPVSIHHSDVVIGGGGGGGDDASEEQQQQQQDGVEKITTTTTTIKRKGIEMDPIGVHSLQYINPNYDNEIKEQQQQQQQHQQHRWRLHHHHHQHISNSIDALYFHHGFGASSLSWLPVLPSLVEQMGARVGVAHDSVGFGFTDRPHHSLEGYSVETNVGIGLELLLLLLNDAVAPRPKSVVAEGGGGGGSSSGEEKKGKAETVGPRNIAIFGHSMGAKAALLMALACSKRKDVLLHPALVVLVAPALEGVALPPSSSSSKKRSSTKPNKMISQLLQSIWVKGRKIVVDYPFRYGLRRLVGGNPHFWKKGLASAWGDPKRLSDSDILRFQWPSISMSWEQGLLNLVRSKLSSSSPSMSSFASLNDVELLRQVSTLPNTKLVIIYGSKDRIVRWEGSVAERVKEEFPMVHMIRMEGLGHDPFEEDVDAFLRELKSLHCV